MRRRFSLIALAFAAGILTVSASRGPMTATAAPSAQTHTVRFGEYFYRPRRLEIRAGDMVRFLNVGKIEHTVADSTKQGTIRSRTIKPRPLKPGQSQAVRLKRPGTVYYVCTFHPTLMRGIVVVR
jgi:plastocyanin